MNDSEKSVHQEVIEEIEEERQEKFGRRICFWVSVILASAFTFWYYQSNPPESEEVKRMRQFFKDNKRQVMEFIRMDIEKLEGYAKKQQHPFYMSYVKASVNEKDKIKALIHTSVDYSPNQYWFNLFFLWAMTLTAVWFIALMAQGCLILVRRDPNLT